MGLDCPGSNWSNNNATPTYLYFVPEKSHLLDCSEFTGSVSEKITAGSWSSWGWHKEGFNEIIHIQHIAECQADFNHY